MTIDLSKLSAADRATLKAQIESEERAERARIEQERESYKQLVDSLVQSSATKLRRLSEEMMRIKQEIFSDFSEIIRTKNELFKVKSDRQSDTFTTSDSLVRLTLGNRINEGWDDTVEAGIEIVKAYLATLAKDDNSANLVETVMSLLAKDRKGALKANKVLELERLAVKAQDVRFIEGINIIKAAYRPVPTCQFIQVEMKDEQGKTVNLPLSLSAM